MSEQEPRTTLGRISLLAPEDVDIGSKQFLSIMDDARSALDVRGVPTVPRPIYTNGEFPTNITQLDDDDLGDLLNRIQNWLGWIENETARADAQYNVAKTAAEFVRARVRIAIRADAKKSGIHKLSADEAKDHMTADPRVVHATRQEQYYEVLFELTKGCREKARRDWETVSRRITQRGQEIERMRREQNLNNAPRQSGQHFYQHRS